MGEKSRAKGTGKGKGTGVPPKPSRPREWKSPVGWLLGPQLIGALKRMVMYDLYKDQLDPRDWMRGEAIDLSGAATPAVAGAPGQEEFWFDYLADAGDGQKAMYSVAYLALSDLWRTPDGKLAFTRTADATPLPRGRFLFVGGDTAYHIADHATLGAQFQAPFVWACRDLGIPEGNEMAEDDDRIRPLYGIPGNHDYYDQLSGFNRQFRRPVRGERGISVPNDKPVRLRIPAFRREQDASYVALRLPWDWWFFGLDTENGEIDARQATFFLRQGRPDKLIVATPEPTTVFGRHGGDQRLILTFRDLQLERPFLAPPSVAQLADPKRWPRPDPIAPGRCRLDLSGDVHHYERYWGPTEQGGVASYASVVSGLGGAFHHPSQTDFGEVKRERVYPSPETSRREIAWRLFWPPTMLFGGFIGAIGAVLAFLVYHGAVSHEGSGMLVRRLLGDPEPMVFTNATPSQFGASAFVLLMCGVAFALLKLTAWASRRAHHLSKPEHRGNITRFDVILPYLFALAAPLAPGVAVWRVGDAPAKQLLWDFGFLLMILAMLLGLAAFAWGAGGKHHRLHGRVGFAALGLLHGFLQLVSPFLLVRAGWPFALGYPLALLALGGLAMLAMPGDRAAPWRRAKALAVLGLWLVAAATLVAVGVHAARPLATAGEEPWDVVMTLGLGAWMSCAWLGWYLAVSLAFNGHNNEVGAATRIEKFKQLIRFRLTKDGGLTAFVIAFERSEQHGRDLRPEVVDEFTIRPAPAAAAPAAAPATPANTTVAAGAGNT